VLREQLKVANIHGCCDEYAWRRRKYPASILYPTKWYVHLLVDYRQTLSDRNISIKQHMTETTQRT